MFKNALIIEAAKVRLELISSNITIAVSLFTEDKF